jgi:5'-nucleotidase / UDP-sugar diphosphatase
MSRKLFFIPLLLASCNSFYVVKNNAPPVDGQDLVITFLHTSDWHARILPYFESLNIVDQSLGLQQGAAPFGGVSRMKSIIDEQRQFATRSILLDSGDCFQGAPIFNAYSGAAEYDTMSAIGMDVQVIGNHEFDRGGASWAAAAKSHASYPLLAANYQLTDTSPLQGIAQPYQIFNLDGFKVGVIGMANKSSITSIFDQGNSLGITPVGDIGIAQFYADFLRPQVNLIVVVSHMGLEDDILIAKQVRGLDMVFGGHNHIVVRPPLQVDSEVEPGRKILITHSGAFMKYLGRVDVVVRQNPADPTGNDWDVISNSFQLFPVDTRTPEDPLMLDILRPYVFGLQQTVELTQPVAYAPQEISRFSLTGGDSPLGNIVTAAMLSPVQVRAQFALTNSTGIRAQVATGPITIEQLFNIFPFDNFVTTMTLSGREVKELMDFVARRSASRGCQTQAQVAGISWVNDCRETTCLPPNANGDRLCEDKDRSCVENFDCRASAEDIQIGGEAITDDQSYGLATNDFIAKGGSGFSVLARNTTKADTDLSLRDGVQNFFGAFPRLGDFIECNTVNTADPNVCANATPGSLQDNCCNLNICYGTSDGTTTDLIDVCTSEVATQGEVLCTAFPEDSTQRTDCESLAVENAVVSCRALPCVAGAAAQSDNRIQRILP